MGWFPAERKESHDAPTVSWPDRYDRRRFVEQLRPELFKDRALMADFRSLAHYPVVIEEKVRLSDTDRQGHVNNVSFSFFFEAGRAAIVLDDDSLLEPDCFFVIVTTTIDFLGELHYPGVILVANAIERIGTSSLTVRQALFQDGRCASLSTSTMAQVNIAQKRSQPLTERCRAYFEQRRMPDTA